MYAFILKYPVLNLIIELIGIYKNKNKNNKKPKSI